MKKYNATGIPLLVVIEGNEEKHYIGYTENFK